MKTVFDQMEEQNAEYRILMFRLKQQLPYEAKKAYAWRRAREFRDRMIREGLHYHTSVGGLDSITLHLWLKSIGIDAPAISVSFLEDRSIQEIHKRLGVTRLLSAKKEDGSHWKKAEILHTFGFPILSKEIAGKISLLQNPTPDNTTVRHAIMTGETGEYGGYQTDSRMKLADKWLRLFGGPENEKEGTHYKTAPFKVSDKCCYYLKEKPCDGLGRGAGLHRRGVAAGYPQGQRAVDVVSQCRAGEIAREVVIIFKLNQLHNVDCMEGITQFPDKYFELAIVDPPYSIGENAFRAQSRSKLAKTTDWGSFNKTWDREPAPREYFDELFRVSQNQIIWGANHYISRMPRVIPPAGSCGTR